MYRPRLAPILTDMSPLTHLQTDDDSLTAIPRPAIVSISPLTPASLPLSALYAYAPVASFGTACATPKADTSPSAGADSITISPVSPTGMPTAASPALDSKSYISPSNPISRFALPTFSPRAYSTFMNFTSPRCTHTGKRSPVPGSTSPDSHQNAHASPGREFSSSYRMMKAQRGMQNEMRQRNAAFASPAVLHLGSPTASGHSHTGTPRLASSPLLDGFEADVHSSLYMATYPVDVPFPLAPSPTLMSGPHATAASRTSRSRQLSVLRLVLPMQSIAFIRAHVSLLLYVALGMLISLTLLSNDPAVRMGLGRGFGLRTGAGQVVDLAVPTMPVHYNAMARGDVAARGTRGWRYGTGSGRLSNMGVWADYADALRGREVDHVQRV